MGTGAATSIRLGASSVTAPLLMESARVGTACWMTVTVSGVCFTASGDATSADAAAAGSGEVAERAGGSDRLAFVERPIHFQRDLGRTLARLGPRKFELVEPDADLTRGRVHFIFLGRGLCGHGGGRARSRSKYRFFGRVWPE